MSSVKKQLVTGVFYTAVSKYIGIVISLAVAGILSRLLTPDDFGIVAVAMVFIAFFGIFSDLGITPAIVQHKDLDERDLDGIFTFTLWTGAAGAAVFFGCSWLISMYYKSAILLTICHLLSINLFFATVNIVPNALLFKAKRFRFIAVRSLTVQTVCGAAAVLAALNGAGIYALLINPICSSVILFFINLRQYPRRIVASSGIEPIRKIFMFSMYQFFFNVINYFTRNLDKLLIGRYMGMAPLGYYEKSYRLMMLPLQNITHVISPVMHPIFSDFQHDLRKLSDSYLKVVKFIAFIGFPLSALLFFTSREITLLIFGPQWEPSVPVFTILALSVGVQIILSTSGSIFQAANSTKILFLSGTLSAILNVAAIIIGIFVFRSLEAVAWSICISFTINFVQCYWLMYYKTFRLPWGGFWKSLVSPVVVSLLIAGVLYALSATMPEAPMIWTLIIKGAAAGVVWLGYIQLAGEYDIIGKAREKLTSLRNR